MLAVSAAALGLVLPTALPTYFTCRHTYESVLQEELVTSHALAADDCSSPLPGLVRVERSPVGLDPVYALQTLPGAVEVSGTSVKSLAAALVAALLASSDVEALRSPCSPKMTCRAPEAFSACFATSHGPFEAHCVRRRAPVWVDRVYNLVANGFYDDQRGGMLDGPR